jgi:hypothetical protein
MSMHDVIVFQNTARTFSGRLEAFRWSLFNAVEPYRARAHALQTEIAALGIETHNDELPTYSTPVSPLADDKVDQVCSLSAEAVHETLHDGKESPACERDMPEIVPITSACFVEPVPEVKPRFSPHSFTVSESSVAIETPARAVVELTVASSSVGVYSESLCTKSCSDPGLGQPISEPDPSIQLLSKYLSEGQRVTSSPQQFDGLTPEEGNSFVADVIACVDTIKTLPILNPVPSLDEYYPVNVMESVDVGREEACDNCDTVEGEHLNHGTFGIEASPPLFVNREIPSGLSRSVISSSNSVLLKRGRPQWT